MRNIVVSAIVTIIIVCIAGVYLRSHPGILAPANNVVVKESTYDRITRTGTIRCGYSVWNPHFYVDPKTNEKTGMFHDIMEEVGKRLGLKIVWQEELGWGSVVEAVRSGRVDASCSGYWLNMGRIKNLLPSIAQIYSPLYVWMRQDDTRSLASLDDLNSEQFIAGTIDGSAESQIITNRFPRAKIVSLPELDTNSDIIENLMSRKVDFIVGDASTVDVYIASNPGKIKNAFPNQPLNVYPNVILLPSDDMRFKNVIDNTLQNIEYDGTLDAILKKYHMEHGFLRNAPPVKLSP